MKTEHKIYALEDFPIFTIRFLGSKNKFNYPEVEFPETEETEYYPEIRSYRYGRPKIMKINNICFYSIFRDKKVVERKIGVRGTILGGTRVTIHPKNRLLVDRANKRMRLIGVKAKQDWIKFEKLD